MPETYTNEEIAFAGMILLLRKKGEKISPVMTEWSLERVKGEERTLTQILIELEKQITEPT